MTDVLLNCDIGETVKLFDAFAAPVAGSTSFPISIPRAARGDRWFQLRYNWTTHPTVFTGYVQRSDDGVTYTTISTISNIGGVGYLLLQATGYLRFYVAANTTGAGLTVEVTVLDKVLVDKPQFDYQIINATGVEITARHGVVVLGQTAGSALTASTLPLPLPADDGKVLRITAQIAKAHTVTTPAVGIHAASTILTWAVAVGNSVLLVAYKGSWWVIGTPRGVTIS